MAEETTSTPESSSPVLMEIFYEIIQSPINLALIGVIALLVYKILQSHLGAKKVSTFVPEPELPRLRRDFTLQELRPFDGTGTDGRVLVAVNGSVYDVTKGKRFYGPGGPYGAFGGRDASRGLATFNVESKDDFEYDDLSDLSAMEMDSVREWEMQFKEKYYLVGKLLKAGEQPSSYSDEEEEGPSAGGAPVAAAGSAPGSPKAGGDDKKNE